MQFGIELRDRPGVGRGRRIHRVLNLPPAEAAGIDTKAENIMIKDKVIIITGASSGIGEATAKLLASKGAKVVLGARRADNLKRIADEIKQHGGQAVYQELDVTEQSENDAIVKLAKDKYGRVDAIFLNAGLMPNSPLSALKTAEWHQMIDVNVKGVLNGVAAVLPEFTAQKSGHVIATSSVAGLKAYPGGAVYGGTKWFVRDFMEVLRMESAMEGTNIRTATIYPAAINTELLKTFTDKASLDQMQGIYDTYGISPDRIASVVAFAIDQPEDTTINEFTVGPANQPW
ncbi:SDR family oxidoreductase [Pseudomonas fulva]|jgi:NADP-dependent 3-hydroxy acid dehydrogenase YdfG|uniref:SDR family oxidoreductase n=1 Tax=Pseudomonas fulva TaxID=47880 RepID=UPI003820F3BB